ncbi:hypothetical protein AAF712_012060 [Marasmius tenuissimus]|uniref:Uncharacterized protein n=1 Tax=Marasmius tenuissimus TaxID=585030 RepID=A0ABR2ZHL1_9AGAR
MSPFCVRVKKAHFPHLEFCSTDPADFHFGSGFFSLGATELTPRYFQHSSRATYLASRIQSQSLRQSSGFDVTYSENEAALLSGGKNLGCAGAGYLFGLGLGGGGGRGDSDEEERWSGEWLFGGRIFGVGQSDPSRYVVVTSTFPMPAPAHIHQRVRRPIHNHLRPVKLVGMFDPRQRSAPFFLLKIWYLGFGVVLSGGRGPRAISRLYLFRLLNDHFPAKSVDYVQNLEVGSTKLTLKVETTVLPVVVVVINGLHSARALGSGNAVESAGPLANIPASRLALSPAVLCFRPPCATFLKTWSINVTTDYQETANPAYLGNPENNTLNSLYEVYSDIGSEAEDKEGHDQDVNMEESDPDRPYTPAGIPLPFPTHSEVHAYAFISIFDRYIKFTFTFPIAITITSTLATPLIPTCLSRRQSRICYIRHATVHENNQDVPHSAPRDLSAPTHRHRQPEVQETNSIRRNRLSQEPKTDTLPDPEKAVPKSTPPLSPAAAPSPEDHPGPLSFPETSDPTAAATSLPLPTHPSPLLIPKAREPDPSLQPLPPPIDPPRSSPHNPPTSDSQEQHPTLHLHHHEHRQPTPATSLYPNVSRIEEEFDVEEGDQCAYVEFEFNGFTWQTDGDAGKASQPDSCGATGRRDWRWGQEPDLGFRHAFVVTGRHPVSARITFVSNGHGEVFIVTFVPSFLISRIIIPLLLTRHGNETNTFVTLGVLFDAGDAGEVSSTTSLDLDVLFLPRGQWGFKHRHHHHFRSYLHPNVGIVVPSSVLSPLSSSLPAMERPIGFYLPRRLHWRRTSLTEEQKRISTRPSRT